MVLQGGRSRGGGEHHPSMGRGRGVWSQCQWTHLPVFFPSLVSQGLVSPCSALAPLHPPQPVAQEGVCSPTHSGGPIPSPAGAGTPLQAVPLCSQGATQMGMEQAVLPAPRPSEHQGSGHTKGFHTLVAALQLVCFQQKQDNSSRVVFCFW